MYQLFQDYNTISYMDNAPVYYSDGLSGFGLPSDAIWNQMKMNDISALHDFSTTQQQGEELSGMLRAGPPTRPIPVSGGAITLLFLAVAYITLLWIKRKNKMKMTQ